MFGSTIIDIAIGMVFIYLLLSLICSAANEVIERFSKQRARALENGIREMLHGDNSTETAAAVKSVYEHPLIYSLFAKPYSPGAKTLPSYIPARNFALALMDLIGDRTASGATGPGSTTSPPDDAMANLRTALTNNQTLPDNVKAALLTFVDASHTPAKVRENIENWFDSSMDRVSGFYKRRSQLIILLLGLFISVGMNVNSVTLVRALSTDRPMRDSLVAAAQEYARSNPPPSSTSSPTPSPSPSPSPSPAAGATEPATTPAGSTTTPANTASTGSEDQCKTVATPDTPECRVKRNLDQIRQLELPIGWSAQARKEFVDQWPGSLGVGLIGWIFTALALSLGAPFWFDLLNKFMVVRGTVKPKEKSPEEESKD